MKIYDIGSYPGVDEEISVNKNTDILPDIKLKLQENSDLSQTRLNNIQILAGTVISKNPCCLKITDGGWIPLLEAGEYYMISFEDVSIKKIQFNENVTLKTFAFYFI